MQWLKNIRITSGKTQKDVADSVGITDAHYNYIENGNRRPSPEVAKRIAEVLGFANEWYKLLETESA